MKKQLFWSVVLSLLLVSSALSQGIPQQVSIQGFVIDSTGAVVNGSLPMTFRLYPDSLTGSAGFVQSFDSVKVIRGVYAVNLNVTGVDFSGSSWWLETEINSHIITPRVRWVSAPYALASRSTLIADSARVAGTSGLSFPFSDSSGGGGGPLFLLKNNWLTNGEAGRFEITGLSNTGFALYGGATSPGGNGVEGNSINGIGVEGNSATGMGLAGSSTNGYGVTGTSTNSVGVSGVSSSSTGVIGSSQTGFGVNGTSNNSYGVYGQSSNWHGVVGQTSSNDGGAAVYGVENNSGAIGELGKVTDLGFFGHANMGVVGITGNINDVLNIAVEGIANGSSQYAGYFSGNVNVTGTLSKGGGSFKIDHPLDPANKYLQHSFVESPDMMNIYNGNAVLDDAGEATIVLPDWFEALNRDFRYQLTAIGAPGPNLYIGQEVQGDQFKIAGGTKGMKVSWQVTGIRKDAWAEKHRIQVEVEKTGYEKGRYLHPIEHGVSESMGMIPASVTEKSREKH